MSKRDKRRKSKARNRWRDMQLKDAMSKAKQAERLFRERIDALVDKYAPQIAEIK